MISFINKVCVCGAGTMGSGIAQVCATAGYTTILYDVNDEAIQTAKNKIENDLQKLVEKQKIDEKKRSAILNKIHFASHIHNCIADLFIEAVIEKMEVKLSLFNQLISINHPQSIYTSNTSSLSITKIAEELKMSNQFIGLHFFNPAP